MTERRLVVQDWYETEYNKNGWDSHGWVFKDDYQGILTGWNVVEVLQSDKFGNPALAIAEKEIKTEMIQTVNTTDGEKYRMYSALDKEDLIKMLIECNKHLQRITSKVEVNNKCFYMSGMDTSGRCINCGKQEYEH